MKIDYVAGIDISKDDFHVCLKQSSSSGHSKIKSSRSFCNSPGGFDDFLRWLSGKVEVCQVRFVMEATGSYYEDLAYWLYGQHLQVIVVLANKIKYFAKSLNVKTKTDKVDASLIAEFGIQRQLSLWIPMSKGYKKLRDICRELLSLKKDKARAKCQLHAINHSHEKSQSIIELKHRQITFYEQSIRVLEQEIHELLEQDSQLKEKVDKITTIKGLGLTTAVTILCETNGFLLFPNIRQVVSYAGLDVEFRESGSYKGKSKISKKGNSRIRQVLFMPSLSASAYNEKLKPLYQRVNQRNPTIKKKGVVAVMRKLLILVFVLWKKNEAFNPKHVWNIGG